MLFPYVSASIMRVGTFAFSKKTSPPIRIYMQTSAKPELWLRFLSVLAFVVMTLSTGCESGSKTPPAEIIGQWITDAPRHRDRIFEIRSDVVLFGTGKFSGPRLYSLIRVEPRPDHAGWKACRLFYREDDGSVGEIALRYKTEPTPMLRFASRDEFWFRIEDRGDQDA